MSLRNIRLLPGRFLLYPFSFPAFSFFLDWNLETALFPPVRFAREKERKSAYACETTRPGISPLKGYRSRVTRITTDYLQAG